MDRDKSSSRVRMDRDQLEYPQEEKQEKEERERKETTSGGIVSESRDDGMGMAPMSRVDSGSQGVGLKLMDCGMIEAEFNLREPRPPGDSESSSSHGAISVATPFVAHRPVPIDVDENGDIVDLVRVPITARNMKFVKIFDLGNYASLVRCAPDPSKVLLFKVAFVDDDEPLRFQSIPCLVRSASEIVFHCMREGTKFVTADLSPEDMKEVRNFLSELVFHVRAEREFPSAVRFQGCDPTSTSIEYFGHPTSEDGRQWIPSEGRRASFVFEVVVMRCMGATIPEYHARFHAVRMVMA